MNKTPEWMKRAKDLATRTKRPVAVDPSTGKMESVIGANAKEKDPTGRSPHEPGAKLDHGKPCLYRGALAYFPRAIEAVAAVSTFGARKYAWKGWEDVPDGFARYSDAMVRHLAKEGKDEVLDPDSGFVHAAHTAWNALARLELLLRERENA